MHKKRLFMTMIIGVIILSGIYSIHQREKKQVSASTFYETSIKPAIAKNKLGGILTLREFRSEFNEISNWEIGQTRKLKEDKLTTSFLYSFSEELALSGIHESRSEILYKLILIGLDNEEFNQVVKDIIQVCDPKLTSIEREEILLKLEPGKNITEDEIYVVKNEIIYRLHVSGNYLYFSIAKDE